MTDRPPLDIVVVLEHYGFDLPSAEGGWRTTKCLFHADSNASGRYSPDAGAYCCMGCEAKGNAVTLIAWKEGIDLAAAFRIYEGLTGGSNPRVRKQDEWVEHSIVPTRPRNFERNSNSFSSRRRRKPFES